MDKIELLRRTREFAIKVFRFTERFPKSESAKVVIYRAVNKAKSKSDFIHKLKVVLEEADESNFWLTFIADIGLVQGNDGELKFLIKESDEFVAIFTASVKTSTKTKSYTTW
jgi:hypothetical protein